MSDNGLVNATVPADAERFHLKSVEGAWVDLKPLPYGLLIERRDKASRMSMVSDRGGRTENRMDIDMMQSETRRYEFNHCVIDHNLGDGNGRKLNFSNPSEMNLLDPKVGQEIEQLIDTLNQLEEVDEENFTTVPTSSSEETMKLPFGSMDEST